MIKVQVFILWRVSKTAGGAGMNAVNQMMVIDSETESMSDPWAIFCGTPPSFSWVVLVPFALDLIVWRGLGQYFVWDILMLLS